MRSLITYFLKYPVLGNTILFLTMVFGFFGMTGLRSTLFPEAESKIINIQVVYPGASPEEVEEGVMLKIEDNLKGITGLERVSSISNENGGLLTVEVLRGVNTDEVLDDVKNAVDKIASFPPDMEPPVVFIAERLNFAMSIALSGEVDLITLKKKAQQMEAELRAVNNLKKVPAFESFFNVLRKFKLWNDRPAGHGISKVSISGFPDEEIEVSINEDQLRAYNLTFAELVTALKKANVDITGGTIKGPYEELLVRGKGKAYYAEGLKDVVIKSNANGTLVRLGQVAQVRDKWSDSPARNWYNGKPAVVVTIENTLAEDILSINNYLYGYIEDFNQRNTVVQAEIVRDGSVTLRQRIELLTENGLMGAILVLVILALFLDRRLAFWVALGIPVSFAGMFILAGFYGLSINVISLFGMILVVGILVDDGIVISENIYQKYEEGMAPLEAAITGTLEVFPAVVSSVLTTVAAFGAFFFLDGRLGEFAPNMAFVVITSLLFSLIEGALLLPAHVAHSKALKKDRPQDRFAKFTTTWFNKLRDKYFKPVFEFSIRHWGFTLLFFTSLLLLTMGAIGGGIVKTTFFPSIERNDLDVVLKMPSGTREHITEGWLKHIENAVWQVNEDIKAQRGDDVSEIQGVQIKLGPGTHQGTVGVSLIDGESRTAVSFDIANMIREKSGVVYGAENVSFGVAAAFGKAVSISLKGFDVQVLDKAKKELLDSLQQMATLKDVALADQPGLREVNVSLKEQALVLGLQLQDVLAQVRAGFFGAEVQRLQRGEDEVKIWVRYTETDRGSVDRMLDMRIQTPSGQKIPLRELVQLEIVRGVMSINHLDGMREARVEADVADFRASTADINAEIEDQVLPPILSKYPGIQYSFEGQSRQNEKVATSMKKVMPVVLVIMFALIVFTFRSFSQSIAVYVVVPFGLIGVAWGHYLHGAQISMLSGFGIIALIGVMVNDSLVFVTVVNNNLKKGLGYMEAIREAGLSRFRPILLTSITTIAGLGPLILNKSFQAQFLVPMAISVGYGLLVSTITTLLLLPAWLLLFNRIKTYISWLWTGSKPQPHMVESAFREMEDEKIFDQ
ncbi:MAG: efflux RND transporter permease subunit [Bacteroidetes bacterium]|jgi:multidrug efflux pump subunit AcrB|nr:efflux RND transporter permease subunit [Bacteroidota bacterium]